MKKPSPVTRSPRSSRRRLSVLLYAFLSIPVMVSGCGPRGASENPSAAGSSSATAQRTANANDWFVDRAAASGLDFTYFNGMSGEFYFPEMIGGGVALFDYDNDGDLDIYFAQGQMLGAGKTPDQATIPPRSLPLRGRLYQNDLTIQADGARVLRFTDVTERSGIDASGYGMGVATGDFDNDGCVDLYLTNFGPNRLYRNNCNGTFTDLTQSAAVDGPGWSVSAAFVDADRDGWLDLYVGNYVRYSLETDKHCTGLTGRRDYCTPAVYMPGSDRLYHNNRDGTFSDVTAKALVGGSFGPALGVSTADFNGDGWPDIYVANDGKENLLWINQRDGTFRSMGLLSGASLSSDGKPEGSMGVDAGDFDNDGDEDLFVANLPTEGHDLYVNDGRGFFEDRSGASGVGPASMGFTGFGAGWFDFDNDGRLDLFVANGSIEVQKGRLNETFPYGEGNLLLRNRGDAHFEDVSPKAGTALQLADVSRGAAFGDIDNDGDADVVVSNIHRPAQLLINTLGNQRHWLGLRVVVGAKIQIVLKDGSSLWRRARADGSYASANDPRVLVGLGDSTDPPTVRVVWPDGAAGKEEEWPGMAIDRWTTLKHGEGHAR